MCVFIILRHSSLYSCDPFDFSEKVMKLLVAKEPGLFLYFFCSLNQTLIHLVKISLLMLAKTLIIIVTLGIHKNCKRQSHLNLHGQFSLKSN